MTSFSPPTPDGAHEHYVSWRTITAQGEGCHVIDENGILFLAAPPASNLENRAFRTSSDIGPDEFLKRCAALLRAHGNGNVLRIGTRNSDEQLTGALRDAGYLPEQLPVMGSTGGLIAPRISGLSGGEVTDLNEYETFLDVQHEVWSAKARRDIERAFELLEPLSGDGSGRAFLVRLRQPSGADALSAALTYSSNGIGGIYWVSTPQRFRRMGLGAAVTVIAAQWLLEVVRVPVVLQATPAAQRLYRGIGFHDLHDFEVTWERPSGR